MKQGELKTIENKHHEFGSATQYQTMYLNVPNGEVKPYQFTLNETVEARKRAIKNEADIPKMKRDNYILRAFLAGLGIGLLACALVIYLMN